MSSRVAYSLAVIIMVSPLVILPSLYLYRQHQMEEAVKAQKARMEAWKAHIDAERLARQNH